MAGVGAELRRGADVEALRERAMALRGQGRIEAWLAAAAAWAAAAPGDARALYHQGYAARQLGRAEAAREAFLRAVELAPGFVGARMELGVLLQEADEAAAAAGQFAAVVRLDPAHVQARVNHGAALRKAGRLDEAEAAYAAALELAPDHFELRQNLANLLVDLDRPEEALAHLRRAGELRPQDAEVQLRQGAALQKLGRAPEAYACYRRALAIQPGSPRAYMALGVLMHETHHMGLAERFFRLAAAADPMESEAWLMVASLLNAQGRAAAAEAAHGEALARGIAGRSIRVNALMYLNNRDDLPAAEVARQHREWGLEHGGTVEAKAHANTPEPGRRLKVGYLSPDFRGHSVTYFLMPLIEGHDRGAVELHAYADVDKPDDWTARYRELFDHWRDVHGLDDAALARLIEADGIDILVELAGHTTGNRLAACALRPAPVQVNWLGYPNTTGLPAIGWRLVDAVTDPPGSEALAVERLCRLPRGFLVYTPSARAPEVVPPPVLQRGHVTFGSFNNAGKLSPAAIACWAELLRALPDARLLLSTRTLADTIFRQRLRRRFRELGIEASRLDLRPGIPDVAAHLATYGEVDIALDPFPYNGTTTTCETLWMGVPMVALRGDRHSARVGASILHGLGLDELVAATPEAYVAKALELARDPARLAGLRAGMRQRMQASPLMDKAGFARDVEAAYRGMWRDWCERQRPAAVLLPAVPPAEAEGIRALIDRAAALRKAGRLDEAEAAYAAGLELDPDHFELRCHLAELLLDLKRPNQALLHLQRAAALRPGDVEPLLRQAAVLQRLRQPAEAVACYRRALGIEPGDARALLALGIAMQAERRLGLAERLLRRAAAADPAKAEAWLMLASVLYDRGQAAEAAAAHGQAFARGVDTPGLCTNELLYLNGRDDLPAEEIARRHREWGLRHGGTVEGKGHTNTPEPGRRLKVGYLSPDFRGHSVGYFLMPLLEAHDRAAVETHAYASVDAPDEMTWRYRELFDHWRDVRQLDDAALARLIEADGIDILVELAGHTAGSRLSACALRPAPVQVNWLGYPNTTGLPAIGWRLVDAVTDPPGAEALAVERLYRLPHGFLGYAPSDQAPEPVPPPLLQRGHVTFGACNNLAKLSPATLACWAELLSSLPDARLLLNSRTLADPLVRDRLRRRFRELGVAASRLELRPGLADLGGYLAAYGEIDIALDPFPYNGTTTTCESLWMGVPVVALAGDRHAGRVGASILHRLGLDELVAATSEAYVAKALELARDPARLVDLRAGLRQRLRASPLMDKAGFARDVETAYRGMWRDWCERQRPAAALPARSAKVLPPQPLPAPVAARLERAVRERRWNEAVREAQRVLRNRPDAEAAWRALTLAQRGLGQTEAAVESARRWTAAAPEDGRAFHQLGLALSRLRRTAEARDALTVAVALAPRSVGAVLELGVVCSRLQDNEAAARHFRRVIELEPGHAQAHANLGAMLRRLGRIDEACRVYEAGLAGTPDSRPLRLNLGNLLSHELCRADEALPHLRRAVELSERGEADPALESDYLLTLNYLTEPGPAAIMAEHVAWGQRLLRRLPPPAPISATPISVARPGVAADRLRIGYLSPDLCSHSVSHFFGPVLAHHDPVAVEVFVYADVEEPDAVTRQLRGLVRHWRSVYGRSDDEVAALIGEDRIDILVELAGHTKGNRLGLLARRTAPVQVSWLGYPNTTGLPTIDWRLVDAVTDPPGSEALAVERLCRLPRGFLSYGTPAEAPAVVPPPALAHGHVTFGSFNNGLKLNRATIGLWGRILAAVPGSHLLLKGRGLGPQRAEARIRGWLAEAGIAPERVRMLDRIADRAGHLGLYGEVDIALDPFPYNGTTTTCEALWMGVPVVTLRGDRHAGRVGASILHRVGLDELVAESEDDYLARAVALAADPARLAGWRAGMRQRMRASPLCDGQGLARDLEAAYREMWRRHVEGAAGGGLDMVAAPDPGMRLHIGGKEPKPGWTILDILPGPQVDLVGSCTDLGAVADGACELVYASHVLEHLGHGEELSRALRECHRVLRPGGRLHVSVPDLAVLAELVLRPDLDAAQRFEVMRMIYGGQVDAHDFHKAGFTWEIMEGMLQDAGFTAIRRIGEHDFFNDTSRYAYQGRKISLNVMATRP